MVETDSHITGIESKRYEPYRKYRPKPFFEAYDRSVWGDGVRPFECLLNGCKEGEPSLDAIVSLAILKWGTENWIETVHIDPGRRWQNGTNESFKARLCDEGLNARWF